VSDLPQKRPGTAVLGPPIKGDDAVASFVPFGIGQDKPHHFIEMAEVMWENRDSLPYAWNILNNGVCDGCSLGPRGLRDDVIEGTHLCTTRLKLLRLNTMPALAPVDVLDIDRLRQLSNKELQELGRIPYPFVYRKGDRGFKRVSWDEAMGIAAELTRDVPGERMGFFATSRGVTNEAYYTFTKAARLLGSNHVDLCARLCHAATVAGLLGTIGYGAPTCSLKDLIGTDVLLLIGTNISNNQPVTMKYLMEAKRKGTRVVVVNTTLEKGLERYWIPSDVKSCLFGTQLMDDFVQVKAGGDIAFMNGVLKALIAKGAQDQDYIDTHTVGFEEMAAKVAGQKWADLERVSGVARNRMEWVAELWGRARSGVTIYSMGLTQHSHGVENVEDVVNLHLARGFMGREKCGILPIRGHSGVQGGGECGVNPAKLPGGFKIGPETSARFKELWGGHDIPEWAGHSTGPMVEAAAAGELDLFYNLGGNLYHTMPDPEFVREAYANVKLRIHQDIVINTSTLIEPGDTILLLPAQTRYEQRGGGTSTNTERRVRFSPEIEGHPYVGECKPEYEIPCRIACAIKPELANTLMYKDSRDIRVEMDETMPIYKGIAGLEKAGDWIQWGGPQLCGDGYPKMPDGKARFTPLDLPDVAVPEGKFFLTTRRGKQFNSIIIKEKDHLQGGHLRDALFIHPHDMQRLGVSEGQRVELTSDHGTWRASAVSMDIAPGTVQAYWPECNVLIPRKYDPRSLEPDYNAIVSIQAT